MDTAAVRIVESAAGSPAARQAMAAYLGELADRFGLAVHDAGDDDLAPPGGLLLVASVDVASTDVTGIDVASVDDAPVGCVGVRFLAADRAEIKRLWVAPAARGLGVGRRLLAEAERWATDRGAATVCLDTSATLVEAIALYRSAGYRAVDRFNDNPYADRWFAKALQGHQR